MKALVVIFEELVPISGGGTPRTYNIVRSLAETIFADPAPAEGDHA